MDKTLERKFFAAFERGGVLDRWLDLSNPQLNFERFFTAISGSEKEVNIEWKFVCIHEGRQTLYDQALKALQIDYDLLMDEIASNIDECKADPKTLETYIYTLLTPFSRFSKILYPNMSRENEEQVITAERKSLADFKSNIATAKPDMDKHLDRINSEVSHFKVCYDNVSQLAFKAFRDYAYRLDVLLLERWINLLWYQKECDIYLFKDRRKEVLEYYLGSYKLVEKYIAEAEPKFPVKARETLVVGTATVGNNLPEILDTERARKYFPKAIEVGFMEKSDTGYKWKLPRVQLGYFLVKVFAPKDTDEISYKALEGLFDVKRLDRACSAAFEVKNPQSWRQMIDKILAE